MNLGKKITNLAKSGLTEMARIVNQIRNLNYDERDFITKRDPNGIYVGLRKKVSDTPEDNTNFITSANTYSNAGGGSWTVDVHGGRIYYTNNVGSTTLEATNFNNYDDVVIKTVTENSFICAKLNTNVNPTAYTIEVYPSTIDNLPPVPPYIPISFIETQANTVAKVTQLMIGDVTWANAHSNTASTVALDNLSVNNNSAGSVQIYGFEHAVNTSVACVSTDVLPFKATDNQGETISWTTIQDIVNVATDTINCGYINACVTANAASQFCTTINSVAGHTCLCDWLAANPNCVPNKEHTNLTFTGSSYDKAGDNVDHSGVYWQRGTRGSNNSSYSQNYGSSIGNSSAAQTINLDNTYLVSNASATTLNWSTNKLNGDWATTGKHTAQEFDVASSVTKLGDVNLYLNSTNYWTASTNKVNVSADIDLKSANYISNASGTTTIQSVSGININNSNQIGDISIQSAGKVKINSSIVTEIDGSYIAVISNSAIDSYSTAGWNRMKSEHEVKLEPAGNLEINGLPGITINNISTKGILTGTTLQEYTIKTLDGSGNPITIKVLGRP